MPVVVDASVVIAALMRDGVTRERLMAPLTLQFVSPEAMPRQVRAHLPALASRLRVSEPVLAAVLEGIFARIQIVSAVAFEPFMGSALQAAKEAEAWNDEPYVALAMLLDAPIWSHDPDFGRVKGIRTVKTADLLGEKA